MYTAGIRSSITPRIKEMTKSALRVFASGWLALTLAFFALRILPGDAIRAQLTEAGLSATAIEQRRADLGLSQPLGEQYLGYIARLMQGDFGHSLYTGEAVIDVISVRAASTGQLAVYSSFFMISIAVMLAMLAAQSGGVGDTAQTVIAVSIGLPGYITGTFLILIVGLANPDDFRGVLAPAFVLGFHTGGAIAQLLAVSIMHVRRQPYITAAHGRGLRWISVELRHVWPNAFLPVLPMVAIQVGFLISGTVITEILFARPGLGRLMLDAVQRRDLPVVQALVLFIALIYGFCLLIAEWLARFIDPRPMP